jgi:predicted RNase H-like HicB family nuclease
MDQPINVEYTMYIWREGQDYIAHALPLDVMSSGRTREEASHALKEAVSLFLATAAEHGTLQDILEESGYGLIHGNWQSPDWLAIEKLSAIVGQ